MMSEPHPFDSYRDFIPDFNDFMEAFRDPPRTVVRANTLRSSPEELRSRCSRSGILLEPLKVHPHLFSAPGHWAAGSSLEFLMGLCHIQALTSHVPVWMLEPGPGMKVLDLCAAPGGKTSQMAQEMDNSGLIVANEKKAGRMPALGNTLTRLGVMNTITVGYGGEDFPKRTLFDRVLVDAPCSGEGKQGYKAYHRPSRLRKASRSLTELQKRLISRGYEVLKPGGRLVYSTCTFNPEENEAVVAQLLDRTDASMETVSPPLSHSRGITEYQGRSYERNVEKCARIYPHQVHSVGFFVACVVRPETSS